MAVKEEKNLYVGIKDPVEMRRSLLESSRTIIKSLKRYEKTKAIRNEKLFLMNKLSGLVKEIMQLDAELKSKLPKKHAKLPNFRKKNDKPKKKGKVPEKIEPKKPEIDELDRLDFDLHDIEQKLSRLS